jgi:hypothetical protein
MALVRARARARARRVRIGVQGILGVGADANDSWNSWNGLAIASFVLGILPGSLIACSATRAARPGQVLAGHMCIRGLIEQCEQTPHPPTFLSGPRCEPVHNTWMNAPMRVKHTTAAARLCC